jgi:hypothetical protein
MKNLNAANMKQEGKNQPIENKDKKLFLECGCQTSNVFCHLLFTFMIEVTNLNGFGIKCLIILNTWCNLKGHLIVFLNS